MDLGNGKTRRGTLVSKTASRAVVEWQGEARTKTFHDNRHDKDVTITASGGADRGCALDCPVVPIHRTISSEDHDWAVNAFKLLTDPVERRRK
jgi:hypothetical protein